MIYFDYAASAQKPAEVLAHFDSLVHSSYCLETIKASSREALANLYGGQANDYIFFPQGSTFGLNLFAQLLAVIGQYQPNDVVLVSQAEHHANLLIWQQVCASQQLNLQILPLNQNFQFDLASLKQSNIKVVALTLFSNFFGPVWQKDFSDLKAFISQLKNQNDSAWIVLDASQVVGHLPIDLSQLNADFVTFSAHKMYGPTNFGCAWISERLQQAWQKHSEQSEVLPWSSLFDATFMSQAQLQNFDYEFLFMFAALEWLQKIQIDQVAQHCIAINAELIHFLSQFAQVKILGNRELLAQASHLTSFYVEGFHSHDLAAMLAEKDICVRAGNLCAQPLLESLQIPMVIRLSFGWLNTREELQNFKNAFEQIIEENI